MGPATATQRGGTLLGALRGYAVVVLGTGAVRGLSFMSTVVLARWLGRDAFGEVAVFLAFLAFWSGSDFVDQTFVRYIATDHEISRPPYLRAALALKIGLNLVLVVAAFPFAYIIAHGALHKPTLGDAILVALLCGVGLNFLSLLGATFQAREQFVGFTAVTSIFYAAAFGAVLGAVALSSRPSTTVVYVAYLTVATVVGTYAFARLKAAAGGLAVDFGVIRTLFGFSRWLLAANVTYLVFQRLDLLLLAAMSPLRTVGEYGAALRIAVIVSLLTGTIAPALLPRATRAGQSDELLRRYLKQAALLSTTLAVPIAGLWFAAPSVVSAAFGDSYRGAATIVRIFLIGTVLVAAYTPLAQLFLAEDRPRKMFYLGVIKLTTIFTIGFVAIPHLQGVGAALAVTVSEAVALVYVVLAVHRLRTRLHGAIPGGVA
jgi:O-antigen/teichoic acid export membrane protein